MRKLETSTRFLASSNARIYVLFHFIVKMIHRERDTHTQKNFNGMIYPGAVVSCIEPSFIPLKYALSSSSSSSCNRKWMRLCYFRWARCNNKSNSLFESKARPNIFSSSELWNVFLFISYRIGRVTQCQNYIWNRSVIFFSVFFIFSSKSKLRANTQKQIKSG